MRKSQLSILAKAENHHFSTTQISFLKREDLSVQELQEIYSYFATYSSVELSDKAVCHAMTVIERLHQLQPLIEKELYAGLLRMFFSHRPCMHPATGDKRIYRTMKLVLFLQKRSISNELFYPLINQYFCALDHQLRDWHCNVLLKSFLRTPMENETDISYGYLCYVNPLAISVFTDDFRVNQAKSLLYQLAKKNRLYGPDSLLRTFLLRDNHSFVCALFQRLYQADEHRFSLPVSRILECMEEFDAYEEEPNGQIWESKLYALLIEANPFYQQLLAYFQNYFHADDNSFFSRNVTIPASNIDLQALRVCGATLASQNIPQINCQANSTRIRTYLDNSFALQIKLDFFQEIKVYCRLCAAETENVNWWYATAPQQSHHITIFPDGGIYREYNKRLIPADMRYLLRVCRDNAFFRGLLDDIIAYFSKDNPFYRDVWEDCKCVDSVTVPLKFNEIGEYHNRKDFLCRKYPQSMQYRINWNKRNLNTAYMIIKAYPYVADGKSKQYLLDYKENAFYTGTTKQKIRSFLADVLYFRLQQLPDRSCHILLVNDYVGMSMQLKQKIRLDISYRHIQELHDELSVAFYSKTVPTLRIPKNTVFAKLRKQLPEEFEWIRTKKRLLEETKIQHHCVWSYADYINKDVSAIYSFVDETGTYALDHIPRRYTIEFCYHKKTHTYTVRQVEGKRNSVDTSLMRTYIETLLAG